MFNTSCKSKCGSTTCQNGGACTDNVCVCPTGYSGNACQTGWSTNAIGTYNCTREDCTPAVSGLNAWQSSITADATNGGYTIDISNFDNSGVTVVGIIDSSIGGISEVTISPASGGVGVDASGTYDSLAEIMNLVYTSAGAGGVSGYKCTMILTKIR
jgi:hypothetical protein